MKKSNKMQYGPHYTVFLGIMEKAKDEWVNGQSFAQNLTRKEVALLNGYNVNTGDYEVSVYQTFDLNSVSFLSRQATYRLASYCMELDKATA